MKCTFCTNTFCCLKCREKHEASIHLEELAARKQKEYIRSLCYICNGEKFPLLVNLQLSSSELVEHVVDNHLPLKCNKCSKVFETAEDLKSVEKCCKPVSEQPETEVADVIVIVKENMGESLQQVDEQGTDDILTPLTQINQRWRRMSKEFKKLEVPQEAKLKRQTSTPMQDNVQPTNHFTDSASYNASSIQISSINCISSSSESDGYSPSLAVVKPPTFPPPQISPKRGQGRKLPVQATPLRQVMSKSIQRAIEQHGHYRQTPFAIQQRKMSFSSSNSSNDKTSSLLKFPTESEAPLDLRLSPALRRVSTAEQEMIRYKAQAENLTNQSIEFEQIEVFIRRTEIKSDSAISNYKSCISDSGRSGSMPDIQFTPKPVGNNFLKKTISFETPRTIEITPSFLMPVSKREYDCDDDDDVFYTPRTTPVKRIVEKSDDIAISIPDNTAAESQPSTSSSKSNLKTFVSTVMRLASQKSENFTDYLSNSDNVWKFNFKKPGFVKKAADFFKKRSDDTEDQSLKRRRTNSSNSSDKRTGSESSPVQKRQRIQARRPINRMRPDELN